MQYSRTRLILASLLFHWRANLAVACGVAVGTAVLTGALLVGDSMRGSLQHLILDRLCAVDEAMVADHFFRAALADELAAVPVILLPTSLENPDSRSPARANRVELIGCDTRFWQLGYGGPRRLPRSHEIVLNGPLAERLGVQVGDAVLLRLPRLGDIPGDSPLGKKQETIRTQRLTVSEIIAAEGLGRFGLRPSQHLPLNAYVSLEWLQERLEQPDRANAILVSDPENGQAGPRRSESAVPPSWRPQLADYGLKVERSPLGYWNITSERMLLDSATEKAILDAIQLGRVQSTLTYLANTLACNGREIPYSTITAIDFAARLPLGPFLSTEGKTLPPLGPDEMALNSWAADQLYAKIGDNVLVTYFEPETIDGQVREKTVALRLAAIVKLSGAAADRALTPAVKGITDELTMADWDPPFPFDAKRVRPVDEQYWEDHGPTPKAFVSLATGRRLWGSRFGEATSIRVAERAEGRRRKAEGGTLPTALQRNLDPVTMGLVFQPVKRQGLAAAAGTTPFGVLFLCFSFFIIVAAVMLVALLFRLGIEQRATQIGTLLAVGLSRRQVGRLLLGEGVMVAAAGSLVGVPLGIGYAALMLLGLRTWWLAAIATPFLRLHLTAASLAIGCISGLVIASITIWLSVRRMGRVSPRRLLAGQIELEVARNKQHAAGKPAHYTMRRRALALAMIVVAILPPLVLLLTPLNDEVRAGAFFISGAVALAALLGAVWIRLKSGATGPAVAAGGGNLTRMALRNAARNPGRSTLTIGLVAAATFLIVSLSAFRLDPSGQTPALHSGNGGFALAAESDQPIFHNLNAPAGRRDLGFSANDEALMAGGKVFSLRVRSGDDASCLNLYRPRQPRVLGVPPTFVERDGFAWADKPSGAANPWRLLEQAADDDSDGTACVPVILEKNTANYSLNLWGGAGETFEIADGRGRSLRLRVAALLADSIFQGDLLMSEQAFLKHFPQVNGYRFFLVETSPEQTTPVRMAIERSLGDYGLAVETIGRRLADFLRVQNTYLSTFQSLGGLGLLLGTFGLAAVQLRNVLERRGELALLRATGFRRRRLACLVLLEHSALLVAGLGIGLVAALLAVLPQLSARAAPLPWASLMGTLAVVLIVGLATGGLAVRAVLRAPLLLSLREENL